MPRQCNKRHKNVREAPYVVNSHRMVLYLLFFSSSFLGLSSPLEITKSEGDDLAVYVFGWGIEGIEISVED
ncbi:hypothetical protein RhiirA5_432829 [Rhizophagus irregularis]|uniref:Uncharacterized protein n=1 Tax=Rhizophagus irregularis TaxID=588596 RepID=A0A2N0NSP8_9GLOM|nr:hypothetical protein RhiirA5_432829 [Rhizophagus irregularis]